MKRYLLFGMITCLTLQAFGSSAWAQEVGRYQLFQGKYTHWDTDQNTSAEQNELFLLDTATGEVSVYVSTTTKGKQLKYWSPAVIDETKPSSLGT